MLILLLAKLIGRLAAWLPESWVVAVCSVMGDLYVFLPTRRRRILFSNLHHAFPDMGRRRRHAIAREHCHRLVELAIFVTAFPYFDDRRIDKIISLSPAMRQRITQIIASSSGGIALAPHLTLIDGMTLFGRFFPNGPPAAALFRPLNQPSLNEWIISARERFGVTLLSRRSGMGQAIKLLRDQGWLFLLFDQNAGPRGALITFLDRVASASYLPGMLAERLDKPVVMAYVQRTAFWRAEIFVEPLACAREKIALTLAANRWLEDRLRNDDEFCRDWLWAHNRWNDQVAPQRRFRIEHRRNYLFDQGKERVENASRKLPRSTRIWIQLPRRLGDAVAAVPLLRALRTGRPDAAFTLIGNRSFLPLFQEIGLADGVVSLAPELGAVARLSLFSRLRWEYPDTYVLFENSLMGNLEAWLTRCPQRFGILRKGEGRRLLTHAWRLPPGIDERHNHRVPMWNMFLRHFGLQVEADFDPISLDPGRAPAGRSIGLICGSSDRSGECWPIDLWHETVRGLAEVVPEVPFEMFGKKSERLRADAVARTLRGIALRNRVGETSLTEFARALNRCMAVICDHRPGMHIANAMGVPVVAILGSGDHLRPSPVFEAPIAVLRPPGCPQSDGARSQKNVAPGEVVATIMKLIRDQN